MIIQIDPLTLLWDKSRSKEKNYYIVMVTLALISLFERDSITKPLIDFRVLGLADK